jgi:hypothetical protein
MRAGAFAMSNKHNVVLYLDRELVEKSKELGFNLSKTFENHLKHLITQFSTGNSVKNFELSDKKLIMAGGEGFEPSTPNLGGWCSIRAELLAHLFSPSEPFPISFRSMVNLVFLLFWSNITLTRTLVFLSFCSSISVHSMLIW